MASYARQSGDRELRLTADRIQARALNRVGVLMRQIPKAAGGDQSKKSPEQLFASPRELARIAAGLSKPQAKDALAINAIKSSRYSLLRRTGPQTRRTDRRLPKSSPLETPLAALAGASTRGQPRPGSSP
jgi:hypothetical protein